MKTPHSLIAVTLAAVLGALIVPALAEGPGTSGTMQDPGMGMGRMGQEMMSRGMMSHGMMGSACAEMMQSMNNGGGRPNSQWQKHPPGGATPD